MTKITRLETENVKRIRAVEITPEGDLVVVGGRNAQGKTSVLDSIQYALAGGKAIPVDALRQGAKRGKTLIEFDDGMQVERRYTKTGSTLVVSDAKGKLSTPQKVLDALCDKIAFDPLDFTRKSPRDQMAVLKQIVGLDFSEQDEQRRLAYERRTDVNRRLKSEEQRLADMPQAAPKRKVDVSKLAAKIAAGRTANAELRSKHAQWSGIKDEIADLESRLSQLREHSATLEKEIEAGMEVDVSALEDQLKNAEDQNREAESYARRVEQQHRVDELVEESQTLSDAIVAIDETKAESLSSAKWPVVGLGFDEDGVTYNGLPFGNASAAEQTRISVAMGVALHPKIRVFLVRDGSLLDDDSMRQLAELAAEHDCQFWVERVGKGAECSVVIEDGMIAEQEAEEEVAHAGA